MIIHSLPLPTLLPDYSYGANLLIIEFQHPTDEAMCQLDKLFGLVMLITATVVFLYYTVWTLLMVSKPFKPSTKFLTRCIALC